MQKINYRIGLDIGVGSVGWSVLQTDQDEKPCKIVDLGVRIFTPAEINNKGKNKPLALDRRTARSARRRLRRQNYRTEQMSNLLCKTFDFDIDKSKEPKIALNQILESKDFVEDPQNNVYVIRHNALLQPVTDLQLAKILLFFVKHRGYKSTSTAEEADAEKAKDDKKMKGSLESNAKKIANLTVGEYIYQTYKIEKKRVLPNGQVKTVMTFDARNHGGEYSKCFYRKLIEAEIKQILQKQRDFGNQKITENFVDSALEIFNKQRNYDDGPNEPSPYKCLYKVGKCTFLPQEDRAPKGAFSTEYFVALQKINQLQLVTPNGKQYLTSEQKQLVASKLFEKQEIKYKDVRKILNLPEQVTFFALKYPKPTKNEDGTEKKQKNPEDSKFVSLATTYKIAKALSQERVDKNFAEQYDKIAEILSYYKSDDKRLSQFEQNEQTKSLTVEQKNELLKLNSSKFGNLSIKAIKRILPFLEQGQLYSDATKNAGFDFNKINVANATKHTKILFDESLRAYLADVTNPVVRRALGQTIKVVNALIDRYGSPQAIFVELARDIKKTIDERNKIKEMQDAREDNNKQIEDELKKCGIEPTAKNMLILKLYKEQDGKSAYSGKSILPSIGVNNCDIKYLFIGNNVQVDHIVPYSKSFDDSWNNKVLVLTEENQNKGERTPLEWLSSKPEQKQKFLEFVEAYYSHNQKKTAHLLASQSPDEEELEKWRSASLNDTRSIAVFAKDLFSTFLIFAPSKRYQKEQVRCVNGQVTNYLGKVWNIEKSRAKDDRHHARDACLIAVASNDTLQMVTDYFKQKYLYRHNNFKKLDSKGQDGKPLYASKTTGEVFDNSQVNKRFEAEYGKFVPQPYPTFANEVKARLSDDPSHPEAIGLSASQCYANTEYDNAQIQNLKPIFISQMPNRKANGKIHEDTIYGDSGRRDKKGKMILTKKVDISELKLTNDKTAIKDYNQESKISDPNTYNALLQRLKQFDGDAKKAFAEPIFKSTKDGGQGNQIKKVKTDTTVGNTLATPRGIAKVGDMLRLDIFTKKGKFYGVPVYVADRYFGKLPTKVCSSTKDQSQWDDISNGYEFCFSLYSGDLFYFESKKEFPGLKQEDKKTKQNFCKGMFYYTGFDRATALLAFKNHDDSFEFRGIGFQTATKFEKYVVGILGDYHKVGKEKRQGFENTKKGE